MTENERLKKIREHLGKTQAAFALYFNLKQGSYADVERGKVKVSGNIKRVLEKEFNINLNWFESGEGEMVLSSELFSHSSSIPMYNFPAAASGIEIYNDPNADKVVGYMDIPGSHKDSFALPCYGHSMYPTLANGDWAVVRPIQDTNEIVWGEVYYIEWGDYRMYKRLLKSDNEREVILWSDNQMDKIGDRPQYAEIVIQKKQIRKLCLITEILKKPNY